MASAIYNQKKNPKMFSLEKVIEIDTPYENVIQIEFDADEKLEKIGRLFQEILITKTGQRLLKQLKAEGKKITIFTNLKSSLSSICDSSINLAFEKAIYLYKNPRGEYCFETATQDEILFHELAHHLYECQGMGPLSNPFMDNIKEELTIAYTDKYNIEKRRNLIRADHRSYIDRFDTLAQTNNHKLLKNELSKITMENPNDLFISTALISAAQNCNWKLADMLLDKEYKIRKELKYLDDIWKNKLMRVLFYSLTNNEEMFQKISRVEGIDAESIERVINKVKKRTQDPLACLILTKTEIEITEELNKITEGNCFTEYKLPLSKAISLAAKNNKWELAFKILEKEVEMRKKCLGLDELWYRHLQDVLTYALMYENREVIRKLLNFEWTLQKDDEEIRVVFEEKYIKLAIEKCIEFLENRNEEAALEDKAMINHLTFQLKDMADKQLCRGVKKAYFRENILFLIELGHINEMYRDI
jgi:hypothetical protein